MQLDNYIFLSRLDSANYIQVKSLLFNIIKIFNITKTKMHIYMSYICILYIYIYSLYIFYIFYMKKYFIYKITLFLY